MEAKVRVVSLSRGGDGRPGDEGLRRNQRGRIGFLWKKWRCVLPSSGGIEGERWGAAPRLESTRWAFEKAWALLRGESGIKKSDEGFCCVLCARLTSHSDAFLPSLLTSQEGDKRKSLLYQTTKQNTTVGLLRCCVAFSQPSLKKLKLYIHSIINYLRTDL